MRTVELLFDPGLEAAVAAAWDRLAAAGLPSLAHHTHPSNRPHVTLGTATTLPSRARAGVEAALAALPLPVGLGGLVTFPGRRRALVWEVTPSPGLRELQAAVWRALPEDPRRNPVHRPRNWRPHATLARSASPGRIAEAAELLADLPRPRGHLVAARSYDDHSRTVARLVPRP
ncbi:2'-5' RNA ligase family protein [Marinactinospora thermotolerans]|uniref:2'-5' RNA ligase superfamily protein n=1 Tax=Marinactinospora thermotolerans DSM 45154 TaxID=1122192 RepID=A0A1T4NDB2_9ACTN|nr:2'-5' RNA ligase family protein [Marinactinospora thermotolerans]SJZ77252.1 2'-5' RNA ligase superfamily protein [Marinactinospora thermotolerans DSM 45154]